MVYKHCQLNGIHGIQTLPMVYIANGIQTLPMYTNIANGIQTLVYNGIQMFVYNGIQTLPMVYKHCQLNVSLF